MKNHLLTAVIVTVLFGALILVSCAAPAPVPKPAPAPAPQPAPSQPVQAPAPAPTSPGATVAPKPAVIHLKYADQNPKDGWQAVHGTVPFLKQIEQATNGRVIIDDYFNQTLTKGPDAWQAVKSGIADFGWMFHGYWANMTPLADVLSLPFMNYQSAEHASGIFWQLYEKYPSISQQFQDLKVLTTWTNTGYFLNTTKTQVKTMDDLKGQKIRVIAGPPVDMMKILGGVPVMIPMPDIYLSLQKGVIDGMGSTWEILYSFRTYEVAKYVTYVPMFTGYFTLAMNWDTWKSLPPDVQKQIESVSYLKGSQFLGKNQYDSAAREAPDLVKKQGFPLSEYTLTQSELDKWTQLAGKPLWDQWVKNMEAKGYKDASQILDTTLGLIKNYKP